MGFRNTLDFLLHDWLAVSALASRARYAEHSRETFEAVLDTCERIAREKFAPFNRLVDTQEPHFDGERVILPEATQEAYRAYAESGMLAASQDEAWGGMQLPYTVEAAGNAFFAKASVSIGFGLLTTGNANLLMAHGTPRQREVFARAEFSGRFSGTMCLSEPQAGSSLGDILSRAEPDGPDHEADPLGPRYRLFGHKMWISAGEHELSENIIHLVLAKIPDAQGRLPPGVGGISLFIVPKHGVDANGELNGERNDVALAGLNHKCGWRGTTNTLLNFGEGKYPVRGAAGALAYRVGAPGQGLACMFHMMNEARIAVGMAATMLGMAGYEASLDYARQRPQGRPIGQKDPLAPPSPIIAHADVKRMLLAQKAYAEGALALALYCARLVDEQRTGAAESAEEAHDLLEILTPIAKSWPSEWCLEANSLAIQVHGGYGYTRDFPVEQYWRDNRLNMIHEGTHGIQALDLLGRKVRQQGGRALLALQTRVAATVARAGQTTWSAEATQLQQAWQRVLAATEAAWQDATPTAALANAVPYMQAFGHAVLAWIWLDVVLADTESPALPASGRAAACRYFFRYELPKIEAWLQVVRTRDTTCADLHPDAF
ncbi:MAG: acyl-CoA dehydrogenase [Limnohabitans sp.]|nr:acyl-CoA dehydrogenase [Limnohabitans sp.]